MEELKNKRILIVCQEGLSFPFYYLANKWKKDNTIAAFFYGPAECSYNKCTFNENTYYKFKEMEDIIIYDSKEITNEYTEIFKSKDIIDNEYLDYIDNTYTHFSSLNEQIISSQLFSRHYHWRRYYEYVSQIQQINWLILNYKNIEKIIKDFNPDFIFDDSNAELARTVLAEVCWNKKIPYISNEYTRYKSFQIPTFSLAKMDEDYFVNAYKDNLNSSELSNYISYVENFRKQNKIMTEENLRFFANKNSIFHSLKIIRGYLLYYFREDILAGNYKRKKKNPILFPKSSELIKYFIRIEFARAVLTKKNKFFSNPDEKDEYVYMPLHLIPESTTFTKSPMYVNELSIIEAVSKSLPIRWKLYVKEHHAMLGERPASFYNAVNRLPNVKMVQINYYDDPKQWIVKSKGVITISGTSAYEAVMLNKPAIVFSNVSFDVIKGIYHLKSFENLKKVFLEFNQPFDNLKECAAYIKTVEQFGENFDLTYLFEQGERIFRGMDTLDSEYEKQLSIMENFYLKGMKISKQLENYKLDVKE